MKGLKTFIAGILTIVLSFLVISTVFIFCISSFASSKNIQKNLESVSILKDVKKVRNSGSVGSQSKITTAINDIYSLAGQYSISSSVVDKMLDSKATKEILGKSVGNITDYVINGKKS
jgi:Na+-transporting methylmalonyl-CoA/oxaloacetate decarboxylase gamma subunit